MENTAGGALRSEVTTLVVVVVVDVDVVDQGPDSQALRIGRASALLSAPLELRTGRGILGDGRTDDGIYYGLHVFQRYQPVASLSRLVPHERSSSLGTHFLLKKKKSSLSQETRSASTAICACMCMYLTCVRVCALLG